VKVPHYRYPIERNVAMELVRVTEAAAMAAARFFGKGDKNLVDKAAVAAMRYVLGYIRMDGIVVIGEGEKDQAKSSAYCTFRPITGPMLHPASYIHLSLRLACLG